MLRKPAAATRYPADPRAVFVLALAAFSAVPLLVGKAEPGSLSAELPFWGVAVWGALLLAGSVLALCGMAFQSLNGIVAEQVGSVIVGSATVFYALIAVNAIGTAALPGSGIILGWGLSCFWRWGQLQSLIASAHRRGTRREVERELRDEL